jgi:hypothetical protein
MNQQSKNGFQIAEVLKRIVKYLLEGVAIGIAAMIIPRVRGIILPWDTVLILALTAAAVFAILDLWSPSVGSSARSGTGIGLGLQLVGGIPVGGLGL